jgi:hypothetical protein
MEILKKGLVLSNDSREQIPELIGLKTPEIE